MKKPARITWATTTVAAIVAVGVGCGVSVDPGQDTTPKAPASTSRPEKPDYTVAQENAIKSAQSYLDMSGFSRDGLIEQLSSSYGEGFSKADATFAVDHLNADWNAEAVESAKSYLETEGFSRSGLIQQLSSSYGEKFTKAQAEYAADKVGL